ncbi:altronate dehydratase family protein [Hymenobacter sp. BT770]|uniref:UxaA family hydrolase n=1 Tax=Hymenobacter sp. BT770 TaxID=2886942 RepID=UPI001D12F602|nr:altronate dehydratase family protein [Hymenobacter sp. BT770]MCC3154823.1 altronate dehydratase family protein [Hymenobacter sp. BT770]MDO3416802.1 altronate dehydratase family protein [Hymenobacter sp. BT770]
MKHQVARIHPADNVLVALVDLPIGTEVPWENGFVTVTEAIPAKHKLAPLGLSPGQPVTMYGVLVGTAREAIRPGGRLTTANIQHATNSYDEHAQQRAAWQAPDVSAWQNRTFQGFHRADGRVGTANYWLVIPLVFCENRNIQVLQDALITDLGYGRRKSYQPETRKLLSLMQAGKSIEEILSADLEAAEDTARSQRPFPNVDGIRFLSHEGGCGGIRQDAQTLCGLLAGYITHPNVAGATVLSLGCQNAQATMLQDEIAKRDPHFSKPLYILDQQKLGTEENLISTALRQTFAGLMIANQVHREPAPLSKLNIGLECGGSDGFSGISANPALGHVSDMLVALGGSVILAEFPELCGVEQELVDRSVDQPTAERFSSLMKAYGDSAVAVGSGFDMNPSPGNIRDGLITDAMKSAGAARKGGSSPVVAVLDYPELVTKPGLNLLCTPGNDVESTTAEVGSGANIVLFTTGLGTPTGNPIAPVVKIASNTALAKRMPDIIDVNTGTVIDGEETIEQAGERILDYVIRVASGEEVAAVRHDQTDFIPWKRGVSL